jgi:putative chitinase
MDKQAFYAALRGGILGPRLEPDEVSGCEAILLAMEGAPLAHCAYAFATAYHETNATMHPVREAYWLSEDWRRKNLRYFPYYGRGYVQLTWLKNYTKADAALGLSGTLVSNLDRAMDPGIAALIMRRGMDEGWFTNKKFADFLPGHGPATLEQFRQARVIINPHDKDLLIARHALQFQGALQTGGWA